MSRFVTRSSERLDLGDGDWVDLVTRLTYGDRAALEQKLLGGRTDRTGRLELTGRELEIRDANLELLRLSIFAWGGPGFCAEAAHPHAEECHARPITVENIAALDETAERILSEIQRRQVRATPDFTKPLPSAAAAQSTPDAPASSS